ncbi:MAG: aldehyde:ferredoxin oxidoreductase [Clostridia bacterium]|nr:aldehyde:ferredoxin oxidoreductase [Clostridia bacterium]
MHGWAGRRLRVDLTEGKVQIENLSLDYLQKWIGGRGFNSEVVYHETWAGMDPFDPANPLCFATGPMGGTFAPLSGRTTVSARSPMTCSYRGTNIHGHGDTNMGGQFAAYMKYAGYDQIVVKGRAAKPVYIWIDGDRVEIRDASQLWGLGVKETNKRIIEAIGDSNIRVACIGPAGENRVRFACVVNSFSAAGGRTGMGAVMGSKNLKAIAVRGFRPVTFADPKGFAEAAWALREKVHSSPSAIRRRAEGTMDLFDAGNIIGINAHKNVSTGYMPGMEETYGGIQWAERFLFRRKGCWSCPVCCGRYTYIKEGKYAGFHCGGPEMESVCNLGPRLDSYDVTTVNVLCGIVNDLGMDSISAGGAISWAMECFEKGLLTTDDTGGINFTWGDLETSMKVLEMMAHRQGFGDILAEGAIRAAARIGRGTEKYVPHCRGLEHISVDPRITLGFSLGYAMSTRGSDHLKNYSCLEFQGCALSRKELVAEVLGPELTEEFWKDFPKELNTITTKPKLVTWSEKNKCVADLVGMCCQAIGSWGGAGDWRSYTRLFRPATGIDLTDEEIFQAAERVINIERAHWNREGSARQDDTHIDRYFEDPVVDGPFKGLKLNREEWAWAQSEYYRYHGWDDQGFVTAEKARELGIDDILPDLEKGRRLYDAYIKQQSK